MPCSRYTARSDKFSSPIFRDCAARAKEENSDIKVYWASCREARRAAADETSLRQLGTFDRVVSRPGCMPECLILSRGPGLFCFGRISPANGRRRERERESEKGGRRTRKIKRQREKRCPNELRVVRDERHARSLSCMGMDGAWEQKWE